MKHSDITSFLTADAESWGQVRSEADLCHQENSAGISVTDLAREKLQTTSFSAHHINGLHTVQSIVPIFQVGDNSHPNIFFKSQERIDGKVDS